MIDAVFISNATSGKQVGPDKFMGHCPAHEDRNPSFSITTGNNGKPLVNCLSGCSQEAVIDGLKKIGAWPNNDRPLFSAERQTHKEAVERRKVEQLVKDKIKHAAAALKAVTTLEIAKEDPAKNQYYINKKAVNLGGLVHCGAWPQRSWDNALIIPIYDSAGNIVSLQAINGDGAKDFLKDGKISGCFHPIGKISGSTGLIVIGEGLATIAAVCEVMECPGVVAFSAGNLEAVAKEIRQLAPLAEIIIIGDEDKAGIEAAMKAAAAIDCTWVNPNMGKKADAWDVWNDLGADGIKAMISAAIIPKASGPMLDVGWFNDAVKCGSVARFLDNPKPILDYIFEDSLLAATVGLLVGPGAAGKSTLSILLLMAIATGRDILPGIFTPTKAGKVLGIFAEDCEEVLHHRIKDISDCLFFFDPEAQDLLRENMVVVSVPGHDLRLFNKEQQKMAATDFYNVVRETVKGIDGLRLLIIDPLSRFHGEEENDNGAGTYFVSLLERIAQETRAAVISLHHVGKRAGYEKSEFNLDAAMGQDAARGASGLTNGVRWQCNLFGIPEQAAKKILRVKDAKPGQYLALRVSKKNYGKPEKVHFLERSNGGHMKPFEVLAGENEPELDAVIKGLLLDAIAKAESEDGKLTRRMVKDGNYQKWKKINTKVTGLAIDQTIAASIQRGEIHERQGKNKINKSIIYLSLNPEPEAMQEVVEIVPETTLPEMPEGCVKNEFTEPNLLILHENELCKNELCKKDDLRYVSTRNHDTVSVKIPSPYGGASAPSGTHREAGPLLPLEADLSELEVFDI